jgi:hypothetical protein
MHGEVTPRLRGAPSLQTARPPISSSICHTASRRVGFFGEVTSTFQPPASKTSTSITSPLTDRPSA